MQADYIYFDHITNNFYFKTNNLHALRVFGAYRTQIDGEFVFAFSSTYPGAMLSLRDFSTLVSKKGSEAARAKIEELKKTDKSIQELKLIRKAQDLGYTFKSPPLDHQELAIEYMLHCDQLGVLYEMGLGKSYIALNYLAIKELLLLNGKEKSKALGALIYAPKIVLSNWTEEVQKFSDFEVLTYSGTPKKREKYRELLASPDRPDIVLLTYDILSPKKSTGATELQEFKQLPYTFAILDEASKIKTHNSNRTKATLNVISKTKYRYLMSGTLTHGNPLDIFSPFMALNPLILGSNFFKFKQKYCEFSPFNKHIVVKYKNLDNLKNRISPFMIVKNREDCLQLPDRIFLDRNYYVTKDQKLIYNAIITQENIALGGRNINVSLPIIKINKLLQVLNGFIILPPLRNYKGCNYCANLLECVKSYIYPWNSNCIEYDKNKQEGTLPSEPEREYYDFQNNQKLEMLSEELELLREKEKVIIWYYYQRDLTNIKFLLQQKKIGYIEAGQKDCDKIFNSDPNKIVFVGQVSKGIGITLNSAKKMIYYSHSIRLDERLQSMDRNYRIGQTNKVVVLDFICQDSIEKGIINLLRSKKDVRDFIHSQPQCIMCEKLEWCQERDIKPYSKKCVLSEKVEAAEKKNMIRMKEMS